MSFGEAYYHNTVTDEVSWDKPVTKRGSGNATDWVEYIDPATGDTFITVKEGKDDLDGPNLHEISLKWGS